MTDGDKVSGGAREAARRISGCEHLPHAAIIQKHAVAPVKAERDKLADMASLWRQTAEDFERQRDEARAAAGELWAALKNLKNGASTGTVHVDSDEDERLADMWHKINIALDKHAAFAPQRNTEGKP